MGGVFVRSPQLYRSGDAEGDSVKRVKKFFLTFMSLELVLVVGVASSSRWRFFKIGRKVGGARSKFKLGQEVKWLINWSVSQC